MRCPRCPCVSRRITRCPTDLDPIEKVSVGLGILCGERTFKRTEGTRHVDVLSGTVRLHWRETGGFTLPCIQLQRAFQDVFSFVLGDVRVRSSFGLGFGEDATMDGAESETPLSNPQILLCMSNEDVAHPSREVTEPSQPG